MCIEDAEASQGEKFIDKTPWCVAVFQSGYEMIPQDF